MNPAPNLYSFPYSLEKAQLFTEKYPRACKNLRFITGKNHYQIMKIATNYFRHDQLKWNRFKYLVKALDDYELDDLKRIPEDKKAFYLVFLKYIATENALDELHPDFT